MGSGLGRRMGMKHKQKANAQLSVQMCSELNVTSQVQPLPGQTTVPEWDRWGQHSCRTGRVAPPERCSQSVQEHTA